MASTDIDWGLFATKDDVDDKMSYFILNNNNNISLYQIITVEKNL